MIAFATVFLASAIAFALVAQGLYKTQPLFQKARFADELIGGLLGLVQACLIFGAVLIILDSFFLIPGIAADPQELRVPAGLLECARLVEGRRHLPRDAHPGVLRAHRLPRPGLDRGASTRPERRRSRDPRRTVPRGRTAPARRAARPRGPRRPPGRADRGAGGLRGPRRPGVARPFGPDRAERGHVRAGGHRLRVPCLRDV